METPILCPSCGHYSDTYEFYRFAKEGFIKKKVQSDSELKNYDPRKLELNTRVLPSVGFILDAVKLPKTRKCCRSRYMTARKPDEK